VLMSTVAANALIFLDQTAVAVASPAIGREFGTRAHELQWVITAYLLALAVFMPAAGPLADNFGRKRLMIIGMLVFGIGVGLLRDSAIVAIADRCSICAGPWCRSASAVGLGQYHNRDAGRAAWLGNRHLLNGRDHALDSRTADWRRHPDAR
jgi:MFS family permease